MIGAFNIKSVMLHLVLVMALKVSAEINDHTKFNDFFYNYRINPKPHLIVPSILFISNTENFKSNNNKIPLAIGYAELLKKISDKSILEDLYKNASMSNVIILKKFVLYIFWTMQTPKANKLLKLAEDEWNQKEINSTFVRMKKLSPLNVLNKAPSTSNELDALWAVFYLTGNELAISQIISILNWVEDKDGNKVLLGSAAEWSLQSNLHHSDVFTIVNAALENVDPVTGKILKKMLMKHSNMKKQ